MSEKTVIQDAAIYPNCGINIKFSITFKNKVSTEKNRTLFKYFSVDNSTCTPGVAININGIDKESILIASIASI